MPAHPSPCHAHAAPALPSYSASPAPAPTRHSLGTLAIADPDLPTPPNHRAELPRAADDPANHRYPESEGLPELGKAISDWYERRFEVKFRPMIETLPLIGSKEGLAHLACAYIYPGDEALVADPYYPVFGFATSVTGRTPVSMPLAAAPNFRPACTAVPPSSRTLLPLLSDPAHPHPP